MYLMKNKVAIIDSKAITTEIEKKMPEWVQKINNKEDMANAIYSTSQEMLIAVDDILIRYFKFSEKDVKRFHKHLKDILRGTKEFEDRGLNIVTPYSMTIVGDRIEKVGIEGLLAEIGKTKLFKEKLTRAGVEYPVTLGMTPTVKKLESKK